MTRFEAAFGEWVVQQRWWIIVATALVVAISASGMRFLSFNTDARAFFSEDNPQLEALEELEDTYGKRSVVFFALAPRDGDVFSPDTLSAVEQLTLVVVVGFSLRAREWLEANAPESMFTHGSGLSIIWPTSRSETSPACWEHPSERWR
jgi:hypothetical protein